MKRARILLAALFALLCVGDSAQARADVARTATATATTLSDEALMDAAEHQTFHYFWEFADSVSGLARERSNVTAEYGREVATIGGTGFGVMAIVVASERGWITRAQALERLDRMTAFLSHADRFHGVFPHWMYGATGRVRPFSAMDDGGDIVETAYLFEGLLTARQYFSANAAPEQRLRARIDSLWRDVDWTWHQREGQKSLWWNRSPAHEFAVNAQVAGWNEALITYVLAASSPTHAIDSTTYHHGWARDGAIRNGRTFEGIRLPLGPDGGGPMFFEHYSFMGLDPRGLKDRYADYGEQCVAHARIQQAYAVRNPLGFKGYGADCWGLTSSDQPGGYGRHAPGHDNGVVTPSAALASFPYTPKASMQALRHFHDDLGGKLWGPYGFADAFDETRGWVANSYLAIDQGPIIVMIENQRTGSIWRLFMSCPEIQAGLRKLGFESPALDAPVRRRQ